MKINHISQILGKDIVSKFLKYLKFNKTKNKLLSIITQS